MNQNGKCVPTPTEINHCERGVVTSSTTRHSKPFDDFGLTRNFPFMGLMSRRQALIAGSITMEDFAMRLASRSLLNFPQVIFVSIMLLGNTISRMGTLNKEPVRSSSTKEALIRRPRDVALARLFVLSICHERLCNTNRDRKDVIKLI